MAYIDGFVIAVPTANKDAFIAHAATLTLARYSWRVTVGAGGRCIRYPLVKADRGRVTGTPNTASPAEKAIAMMTGQKP